MRNRARGIRILIALLAAGISAGLCCGQDEKAAELSSSPPSLLLLRRQEVAAGKRGDSQRLEVNISRASDRLDAPSFWISLDSLTAAHESLSFDPFDSFKDWEQAQIAWNELYNAHPELLRWNEELAALLASEQTSFAVRRDDLGYLADSINLSQVRYMRVVEVHLFPGHQDEFAEGLRILADAYKKMQADSPWMVYQVDVGGPLPIFLIFLPMSALSKNDDLLKWQWGIPEAVGEEAGARLSEITRASYASLESNLYAVRPEKSHVSREFADGDPEFWRPDGAPGKRTSDPNAKPAKKSSSPQHPAS
jgi:hypothetical protein